VAEGTPTELKRRIPGGHIELHFSDVHDLQSAASLFNNASSDLDQLVLQVPDNGGVAALRQVLDDLDNARIEVEQLSIHTPDLDDVFFAVTGRTSSEANAQEALER
jgi:ABC-2 type transport system ATP-binding protein